MKYKLLSIGNNRKLGKKIGVLNLPPEKTCPGASAFCSKVCYAKKAYRMYPSARNFRNAVFEASKQPDFPAKLLAEIQASGVEKVRLHESGDVYDQAYLDKLIEVMKATPEVRYLMYTKSTHLDFSAAPDNLSLFQSTDKETPGRAGWRKAHTVAPGDTPPKGYLTCKHASPKNYCGVECGICWGKKGNVFFPQH